MPPALLLAPPDPSQDKQPEQKSPRPGEKDKPEETADRQLIRQLEARVRTLEHEAEDTILIPRDNQFATASRAAVRSYQQSKDQKVKEADMSCQICYGFLTAFSNFSPKDESPYLKGTLRALARFRGLMENVELDQEITSLWIKTFLSFPTYDKPGKSKVDRISYHLLGTTLIFLDEAEEKELTAKQPQMNPQMLPTSWTQAKGVIVPIQHLFTVALRAGGGTIMKTRAPKGNLVRRFKG